MRRTRALLGSVLVAALLGLPAPAASAAEPQADRVLPLDRYTSDKGRTLAQRYDAILKKLNAGIFNCMPWLDVKKEGIGFYKPKHLASDARYLSLNVDVDQQPNATFVAQPIEGRASAMFSRYVPPLLRAMTGAGELLTEPQLDGFTVIVSWLQKEPGARERPVFDTIAAFMAKPLVADYLAARVGVAQLAEQAQVLAWDGETRLGQVKVRGWVDDFVRTYRVTGYTPDPRFTCR